MMQTQLSATSSHFILFALDRYRLAAAAASSDDPLPSWNDGAAKKAILDFVDA